MQAAGLRALPQVQRLLETPHAGALAEEFSRTAVLWAVRDGLREMRERLLTGGDEAPAAAFSIEGFFEDVRARLLRERLPTLRWTINAAGIVIHTNLGHAPLAAEAIEAVVEVVGGYSNVEMDLAIGQRGSRYQAVDGLLRELTGAQGAG